MKKLLLTIFLIQMGYAYSQDNNILISLGEPSYGISSKMNFPNYTGGFARGYMIANENISQRFFELGVISSVNNGHSSMDWGWLGPDWTNPFMTFLPNGNIGIETTNNTYKFNVNGKIRAHEIKVETANWPDYVFEQDYEILGLQDLDAYIKAHKHLPEMPTAKEVEANGVELGDMSKLLLKKVEELTLHFIDKG